MEHAVYVQDKWAVSRKLTVNAGLRFQTANGGRAGDAARSKPCSSRDSAGLSSRT